MGLGTSAGKLTIVVQHFFKMRNSPVAIDAVAVKAAINVIPYAAQRHFFQRGDQHRSRLLVVGAAHAVEQKDQIARLRKLWPTPVGRVAEATVFWIELLSE